MQKQTFISGKDESVRMFKSDFLEFFSHIPWFVPLVVWMPIVLTCWWAAFFHFGLSAWSALACLVSGLLIWTLTEYVLHRFVFHFVPKGKLGERIHFVMHGVHHDYPNDSDRLVMPPVLSIPMATPFFALFYFALGGEAISLATFASFIMGYLVYDTMHYALHHWNFKHRIFQELKQHHMIHHFHEPENGFGVSSKLWDVIFKTMFKSINKNKP